MINDVNRVIVYSQTTCISTAQGELQRLVLLETIVLELDRSLRVMHMRAVGRTRTKAFPLSEDTLLLLPQLVQNHVGRGARRQVGGLSSALKGDMALILAHGQQCMAIIYDGSMVLRTFHAKVTHIKDGPSCSMSRDLCFACSIYIGLRTSTLDGPPGNMMITKREGHIGLT